MWADTGFSAGMAVSSIPELSLADRDHVRP